MQTLLKRYFPGMRFSWHALVWAPMFTPLVVAALFSVGVNSVKAGVTAFVVLLVFGYGVSFASTAGLLLPALCVLSRFTRLAVWKSGLAGLLLSVIPYLAIAFLMWSSSGADSGPPDTPFRDFLLNDWNNFILWSCLAAGVITGVAFMLLAPVAAVDDGLVDRGR